MATVAASTIGETEDYLGVGQALNRLTVGKMSVCMQIRTSQSNHFFHGFILTICVLFEVYGRVINIMV